QEAKEKGEKVPLRDKGQALAQKHQRSGCQQGPRHSSADRSEHKGQGDLQAAAV
ncbi:hypothetical protein GGH95_006510, partial [Coemansia sp. RSA 1836]